MLTCLFSGKRSGVSSQDSKDIAQATKFPLKRVAVSDIGPPIKLRLAGKPQSKSPVKPSVVIYPVLTKQGTSPHTKTHVVTVSAKEAEKATGSVAKVVPKELSSKDQSSKTFFYSCDGETETVVQKTDMLDSAVNSNTEELKTKESVHDKDTQCSMSSPEAVREEATPRAIKIAVSRSDTSMDGKHPTFFVKLFI